MNNAKKGHVATADEPEAALMKAGSRGVARIVGMLFIVATVATMISQIMMEPLKRGFDLGGVANAHQDTLAAAVIFEIINATASAGIAISLYPLLRRCSELPATGYMGLRVIEGSVGVVAATGLIMLLETKGPLSQLALALHDWMFLLVLIVFSLGTFLLYPMLFRFRLIPRALSVWGLVGGALLQISCVSILFGWVEMGGQADLLLSLPIWVNEMVLAIWLIFKGFNLSDLSLLDSPEVG